MRNVFLFVIQFPNSLFSQSVINSIYQYNFSIYVLQSQNFCVVLPQYQVQFLIFIFTSLDIRSILTLKTAFDTFTMWPLVDSYLLSSLLLIQVVIHIIFTTCMTSILILFWILYFQNCSNSLGTGIILFFLKIFLFLFSR